MWRAILFLVFAVCAGPAAAQTVDVRAGEHDRFTRLVFKLPARLGYDLHRSEGQARLAFDRPGLTLDTSTVFQRVPKTRLTGIDRAPDGGAVILSLACDCDIETFWFSRASLVVDIRDPSGRAAATKPASKDDDGVTLTPMALPEKRRSVAAGLVAAALDRQTAAAPPRTDVTVPAAEMVKDSRARLIGEFGRAASQGLLSPRRVLPDPARAESPATRAEPPATTPPEPVDRNRPNIQLHAETSIDRDMRAIMTAGLGDSAADHCRDAGLVDVAAWGGDAPFGHQIARLRAGLVGEFDRPNAAAVRNLARLYIHYGFGAEARLVLEQFPEAEEPDGVLADLAAIVETGAAGPDSVLAGQMDCEPALALWSVLSRFSLPDDVPFDTDAVLRGFSALPTHLRAHLGPVLARRFLEAGHESESARVRRILDRSKTTDTPAAQLLEAEIALSQGDRDRAEDALATIVEDNAEPSAEALLRLIETRLDRGTDISYDLAQLAGAYAVEYRGRPLGADLSHAYLSALAASGAFDQAFAELPDTLGRNDGREREIRSSLVGILTERADDYEFLRHVLAQVGDAPATLDPETTNQAAQRLLSLGFVDVAGSLVGPEATGRPARARKLLRAEIALRRLRPRQAEAELLGTSGADADLLRARARSMAGDHEAARALFAAAGMPQAARREAWLGRDWEALADDPDTALAAVAELKLGGGEAGTDRPEGVLARSSDLIADSSGVRDAIRTLLKANPAPD